jgi:hypothetical protein
MATEIVLKEWNRVALTWPGAHLEEEVLVYDGLYVDAALWVSDKQYKFLSGKKIKSKIIIDTPVYPEGFKGTTLYTKIILIFENDHEAFEFIMKYL